ncbi:Protein SMG9 [Schistosoma japonicum]|nr:Protein SMG9 [Schistosoma japonicum]
MKKEQIKSIADFFSTPLDEDELIDGESKPDELYTLCDDPMQVPIKLIDEHLRFVDIATVQDLFVENSGFLVVGAIGLQGSGKSSVLNILANCISDDCGVFNAPFNVQTIKDVLTNSPCTGGINLYITQDRVILLDTQPLLSFALTNYHTHLVASANMKSSTSGTHPELSPLIGPGNWNMDVWAEMASIQIVSFLVNVCHVVLVVSDNLTTATTQLHCLIDRAIGLKPTVFTPSAIPTHGLRGRQQPDIQKKSADTSAAANNNNNGNNNNCTDIKNLTTIIKRLKVSHSNETNPRISNEDSKSFEVEDVDVSSLSDYQQSRIIGRYSTSDHILEQYIRSAKAESKDVSNAINRLINLTDYSASLIHVYNQAPAAAYLDPVVCEKLDRYRNKILPLMYPEYRRLASLVSIGPRILSSHLESRNRDQSATACQNSIQNDTPAEVDRNTADVKPPKDNLEKSLVVDNSAPQNYSGFLDTQDNSVLPIPSGLSEPSSVSSDKGRASSQKPSNISAETLISEKVDSGSKSVQEKSKPVKGEKSNGHISLGSDNNNNYIRKFGLSESEIISQCCNVLHNVEEELNSTLKHANLSTNDDHHRNQHRKTIEKQSERLLAENQFIDNDLLHIPGINGEKLNASLVQMYHDVQTTRFDFFDIQKRLDQPRLFLLPDVDDEGHAPLGCPTYLTAARILQEAVFSTPRQHMMPNFTEKKITYVQKMWDAVVHSPLLLDYHSVRMNQI